MFLQASVILSTGGGGGVCLSACWDTTPPRTRHPRTRHPLSRHPPGTRHPPRTRHTPRTRHNPWDQTHTHLQDQTPPWDQTHNSPGPDTPWDQTAPPPKKLFLFFFHFFTCSGIWLMSGQHASYWNAFLFKVLRQIATNWKTITTFTLPS